MLTAVAHTAGLVTPIGSVAFDPGGDLRKPVVSLYRVYRGKVEFVTQLRESHE